jgi:hypothetical protein
MPTVVANTLYVNYSWHYVRQVIIDIFKGKSAHFPWDMKA